MNSVTIPESVAVARPDPSFITAAEQHLATARESYAVITTTDMALAAGEDLKAIKRAQNDLEAARTGVTGPLNQVVKTINGWFKGPAEMLSQAERIVKTGILTYQQAEERKRREAEARAAEAARKEREKLEAQAAKAASKGQTEKAEALSMTAAAIPERVEIASSAPKLSGVATKSVWKAEVVDKAALVRYVAEHPEWLGFLEVNAVALNAVARSQREALSIPGVKAIEEKVLASRSA